ncbi:MAG: hypothetical protein Q4Q20_00250 [Methanocorpusculum sp.]|nr:hypothetical protein [Methanocorpusculum sp.]
MRKTHILFISAVFLLCAVLCTAGCISSSESDVTSTARDVNGSDISSDIIIGDWIAEDGSAVTTVTFSEDKSGSLVYDVTEEGSFTTTRFYFTWENNGDNTYLLLIADELKDGCTLNADGSKLTLDGSVFSVYVVPEMAGLVLEKMQWE